MGTVTPSKMQAPAGTKSAFIEGHDYDIDKQGQIKVAVQAHVDTLRRHGFTDVIEDDVSAEDIKEMDKDELTAYVEERGGDVPRDVRLKSLRIMAYEVGGFKAEADKLRKKA